MPLEYTVLVVKLAMGALAIQSPSRPLDFDRAFRYGVAAAWHGARGGVDPFELIALARNESDFVENSRGPDGKDCGLTQTRVTITRYSCRQLRGSYWLAFQEAARELGEYAAACRRKPDYDRCRINKYNSGAHYARRGPHGRYFLRVQCFARAAQDGVPVANACRKVRGKGDIARLLRSKMPPTWRAHPGMSTS
jgi:hypothetical protein